MKSIAEYSALILAMCLLSACEGPPYYTSEPFDAQVVDADTGRPIESAVVLARWQLYTWSLDSPPRGSVLELLETATDKEGRFHIEGFTKLNLKFERLIWEDPGLIVYKPGYFPERFQSAYTREERKKLGATRKSELAGKTLRLMRWDGDKEKMARYLSSLRTDLGPIFETCLWTAAPQLIKAFDGEAKRLRREDPKIFLSWVTGEDLRKNCGMDPKTLFNGAAR